MTHTDLESRQGAEFFRYVANGLFATGVNFGVLAFLVEVVAIPSAAISSVVATIFGVSTSFVGSRYFVFRNHTGSLAEQASRFIAIYVGLAALYALLLLVWTDWLGFDYRIGFLIATAIQVIVTYLVNKTLVFGQ